MAVVAMVRPKVATASKAAISNRATALRVNRAVMVSRAVISNVSPAMARHVSIKVAHVRKVAAMVRRVSIKVALVHKAAATALVRKVARVPVDLAALVPVARVLEASAHHVGDVPVVVLWVPDRPRSCWSPRSS
jgi:hypothetical protein